MKALPWTLALLTMLALTVHPAELTDAELDAISREDIVATVQHLQRLQREAVKRAEEAEAHEAKVIGSLQQATRENTGLQTALVTVERTATAVEADRDAQAIRAHAEKERADKAEKLAAHRGVILSWLGAAVGLFLGLQVIRLFPTIPYAFLIPAALAVGGWFAALLL